MAEFQSALGDKVFWEKVFQAEGVWVSWQFPYGPRKSFELGLLIKSTQDGGEVEE